MVSRTRIPIAMMRDGSGEPQNEEMIQDYPCGEETGHYFISSPLNVYSIGRSGAVVLYVEGGCPDFTSVVLQPAYVITLLSQALTKVRTRSLL